MSGDRKRITQDQHKKILFWHYKNMEIRLGKDKNEWDSWALDQGTFEFLQSWDWGEFQKEAGFEVVRLQMFEEGKIAGQLQGFVYDLKIGKYLYLPRIWNLEFGIWNLVLDYLKKQGFIFLRIEPTQKEFKIQNSKFYIPNRQPKNTLILNLEKDEETLLSEMHSKTRYNIHLAKRKGVEIKQEKNINVFLKLNEETTGRDNFKSHGRQYYEKMLKHNFCHQITAYFEGQAIASNIFIHFGKRFTYLHGTSSNKYRNLMAPYLLQWKGIELGKRLDCTEYDFWGVAPDVKDEKGKAKTCFHNLCWDVNHRWTGVTRFKAGFGGERKDYEQAIDVVLNGWKYKIYQLAKKFL